MLKTEELKFHLDMQDEEDREKTALFGLNGEVRDDLPFKIQKNCVTCAGPNELFEMKRAFRMACLSYEPNKVMFRG
jgi:hypothetical protein